MSKKLAAIMRGSVCAVGVERGASKLLPAGGTGFGACRAGATLLAAGTLEAVVVFLFFLPFLRALDEATWAYKGWDLG